MIFQCDKEITPCTEEEVCHNTIGKIHYITWLHLAIYAELDTGI